MPEAEPQQIPTVFWLLQSGGLAPLVWGLIIAVLGFIPVVWPNRKAGMIVGFLSLVPILTGLIAVYFAASEYAEMASSPTAPKPIEFTQVTGRAMSFSFCALLGTLIAVFIALMAILRSTAPRKNGIDEVSHDVT